MTAEIYGFARSLNGVNVALSPKDDTGPFTARPFLSIEPNSFHLAKGETKVLNLSCTVPENVSSGGKYAIVAIKTAPKAGKSITVSTAIQVLVMLTIKDTKLIKTGNITDLNVSKSKDGVAVDLIFKNTGNVHYKPLAQAVLKDENNRTLAEAEINLSSSNSILPTDLRSLSMDLVPTTSLAPGLYRVETKVTNESETVLDSRETTIKV